MTGDLGEEQSKPAMREPPEGDTAAEIDLDAHQPRGMKISLAMTSRWICDVPS